MKFKDYLKDNWINFTLIIFVTITIEIILMIYDISLFIRLYIFFSVVITYILGMFISYLNRKSFYKKIFNILNELDKKYLISEMVGNPTFLEGKFLKEILQDASKSMTEHVNEFKFLMEDYKEYIELWIHEIKIPIATSKMIIENNKNEITKNIDEELDKIDDYTEQALFYARSNVANKDYIIKKTNLEKIVNSVIIKNKNELMQGKIHLDLHDIDVEVKTDSKWIIFILNQIIHNSIKYKKLKEELNIEILAKKYKENIILYIKDNGIGIKESEISRVFEKGFTGTNGRILNKKSTGIGLYLCKKLCDKLGLGIKLSSKENIGTEVKLIFPQNSFNGDVSFSDINVAFGTDLYEEEEKKDVKTSCL